MNYEQPQKVSLQDESYDMITAATQRTFNDQLAKMYKANPALKRMSVSLAEEDDDFSGFEADLGAPTIELLPGTENRAGIYCFNIRRATLKYLKIQGRKSHEEILELPACVLSFSVNLTIKAIGLEQLPEEMKKCLPVVDRRDVGVRRLSLDFTTGGYAPLDGHRSTILGHIKDPRANLTFRHIIQKYLAGLGTENDRALHAYMM